MDSDILIDDFNLKEVTSVNIGQCHRLNISDRNHLGIQVENGVEVVTLDCSATTDTLFRRSLIKTPDNCWLQKWERTEHVCPWMFDHQSLTDLLMPYEAVKIIANAQNPIVMHFQFSPGFHNKTYLAILTNLGSLTIHRVNVIGDWIAVADITHNWLKICSENWTKPANWPEWRNQLNQAMPVAICWVIFEERLFLITAFEDGNFRVFSNRTIGDQFEFVCELVGEESKPARHISSFRIGREICLVASYASGQISGIIFNPENGEVLRRIGLYLEHDLLETGPICCGNFNEVYYVATAKIEKVLVFRIRPDFSFTVDSKEFLKIIKSVSIADDFLYVTLSNSEMIKVNLELTQSKRIYAGKTFCPSGSVTTFNGYVYAIAEMKNNQNWWLKIFGKFNYDVVYAKLLNHLKSGGNFSDVLDLLWLYKAAIINCGDFEVDDEKNENNVEYLKLCYLKLKFKLASGVKRNDDKKGLTETFDANLEEVVRKLLTVKGSQQRLMELTDDCCLVCGEVRYVNNNLRNATCKNDHSLPRCFICLKSCLPFSSTACSLCDAKISANCLSENPKATCIFCDTKFYIEPSS